MLILSQDKMKIVSIGVGCTVEVYDNKILYCDEGGGCKTIGFYSDKSRAKEILRHMCDCVVGGNECYELPEK